MDFNYDKVAGLQLQAIAAQTNIKIYFANFSPIINDAQVR